MALIGWWYEGTYFYLTIVNVIKHGNFELFFKFVWSSVSFRIKLFSICNVFHSCSFFSFLSSALRYCFSLFPFHLVTFFSISIFSLPLSSFPFSVFPFVYVVLHLQASFFVGHGFLGDNFGWLLEGLLAEMLGPLKYSKTYSWLNKGNIFCWNKAWYCVIGFQVVNFVGGFACVYLVGGDSCNMDWMSFVWFCFEIFRVLFYWIRDNEMLLSGFYEWYLII